MHYFSLLFLNCLLAFSAFSQSIIYVTPSGAGTNSGASWTNALPGPQLASRIATASTGTQFWVAAGTYKPTTTTDRTASFSITSGVSIYGGFAGNETALNRRKTDTSKTILSGNIGQPDSLDNSYHILILNNVSSDTHLDNLVITEGNSTDVRLIQATGDFIEKGAVININSDALFTRCTFTRNSTYSPFGRGGGMANQQSSPTLINCVFSENFSYLGSGLYNTNQSNPILLNCLFTKNRALWGAMGSAAFSENNSLLRLIGCTITQNVDEYQGPIASYNSPLPVLQNCIVWGNTGKLYVKPSVTYQYSLAEDIANGNGNLSTDPLFMNPANGDFRLKRNSPAINAGNPDTTGLPVTDIAGDFRVQGGRVDIGAYEFSDCSSTPCLPFTVERKR
jgi:hypothetical protein